MLKVKILLNLLWTPLKFLSPFFIFEILKPTLSATAVAATEFLILCKPNSGIFIFLIIIIFLLGNLIFKSYSEFDLKIRLPNKKITIIKKIKIPLLGSHNIKNSVAATAVALNVGLSISNIKKGLKNFKGVQRRFNKIFTFNKVDFFDDYAHHPTEIKEVLSGVKSVYSNYEKICIFQPHRISRLKDLKSEFASAFKDADKVILFPIYTAGEKIKLGFSYYNFAKEIIKKSKVELFLVNDKYQLAKYIKHNIYGDKIVIGMGAGSISLWMREMPKFL